MTNETSSPAAPEEPFPRMTLPEHLDELRARLLRSVAALLVAMVLSFIFWETIWEFVSRPYLDAAAYYQVELSLQSLDPGEGFISILKLCFLVGVVAASPIILWQLWGFIAAGLYEHEQRYVRIFFPISLVLFAVGMVFAYVFLIPFGLRFLVGWNLDMAAVASHFRIQTYISICMTMVFGMAVLFQLPLVMLFLQAANIVRRETFGKGWRVAVLLSFVVGMFLTDPSPITQIAMAVPVVGLYFVGWWAGRFVGEDRVAFRWYKAWPVLLGLLVLTALLVYAEEINDAVFGESAPPVEETAPTE